MLLRNHFLWEQGSKLIRYCIFKNSSRAACFVTWYLSSRSTASFRFRFNGRVLFQDHFALLSSLSISISVYHNLVTTWFSLVFFVGHRMTRVHSSHVRFSMWRSSWFCFCFRALCCNISPYSFENFLRSFELIYYIYCTKNCLLDWVIDLGIDLLRPGQEILHQIKKEPTYGKSYNFVNMGTKRKDMFPIWDCQKFNQHDILKWL